MLQRVGWYDNIVDSFHTLHYKCNYATVYHPRNIKKLLLTIDNINMKTPMFYTYLVEHAVTTSTIKLHAISKIMKNFERR